MVCCVLCRMNAVKDIAFSVGKGNGGFEEFEKDLYFTNAMSLKLLENFMGY